ncbi:MAG: PD-(D/E)XK nuclease family protein [Oscillospiraceae bacterium]|nr:PD-(D/E)XK nuclease family protein [Oscillospiraceae bacterium]
MLNILYGLPKTGKSYAMAEQIRDEITAGGKCLVIIPDQFTFEYERLLYNRLGAGLFNGGNLEILSFSRLSRFVFERTVRPDLEGADLTAKLAVMFMCVKKSLADGSLVYFKKQAARPDFAKTVMTMTTELIHSGVTPEILGGIADKAARKKGMNSAAEKLSDLHILYSAYAKRLGELGLRDSAEDTRLAAREAEAAGLFEDMSVYIDGFKSFTGDQYDMLSAVLKSAAGLTFCATAKELSCRSGSMFAPVCETVARLMSIAERAGRKIKTTKFETPHFASPALAHMSEALTLPLAPFPKSANIDEKMQKDVTIISAENIQKECAFICSEIRKLLREDNTLRPGDIAVLSRTMHDDISLLESYFNRFEIPYYSDKKPSAAHKPLTVAINAALELVAAKIPDTEAILRLAKTRLTDTSPDDSAYLENYCYIWDIDGNTWNETFPDERAEDIKNRLLAHILQLKKDARKAPTGKGTAAALRKFIARSGIEKRALMLGDETDGRESRRIAEETEKILLSIERAVPEEISLSEFREIFALAASSMTLASPPVNLDGVLAQQSDLARLSEVKIVFVMGAGDGIFPFSVSDSATFSDREREFFKAEGSDLTGNMKKRAAEEKFNAYNALCSPCRKLYISYPCTAADGSPAQPSRLISEIMAALPFCGKLSANDIPPELYCCTPMAAFRTAAEQADTDPVFYNSVKAVIRDFFPEYNGRFEYLEDMRSSPSSRRKISAFAAGKLGLPKAENGAVKISPSAIEDYIRCPFMYFGKRVLGISSPQKQNLSPIVWGNVVHKCMERIISGKASPKGKGFMEMTENEIAEATGAIAEEYKEKHLEGSFSKSPDFGIFYETLKGNIVRILLHAQAEFSAVKFTPAAFEERVLQNVDPGGELTGANGKFPEIYLSGICDRADIYSTEKGKYLRIVDYKTSGKKLSRELIENGINLQTVLYLSALADRGKFAGAIPAGTFYSPVLSTPPLNSRTADRSEIAENINKRLVMNGFIFGEDGIPKAMCARDKETPDSAVYAEGEILTAGEFKEIIQKARGHIIEVCKGVLSGSFPASPLQTEKNPCDHCDFKDICTGSNDPERRNIKVGAKKNSK